MIYIVGGNEHTANKLAAQLELLPVDWRLLDSRNKIKNLNRGDVVYFTCGYYTNIFYLEIIKRLREIKMDAVLRNCGCNSIWSSVE